MMRLLSALGAMLWHLVRHPGDWIEFRSLEARRRAAAQPLPALDATERTVLEQEINARVLAAAETMVQRAVDEQLPHLTAAERAAFLAPQLEGLRLALRRRPPIRIGPSASLDDARAKLAEFEAAWPRVLEGQLQTMVAHEAQRQWTPPAPTQLQ